MSQFHKKIIKICSKIFPIIVPTTYFLIFLETYTYFGFLSQFFLVDSRFIMIFTFLIGLVVVITDATYETIHIQKPNSLKSLVFNLNKLLLPIIFIIYFILQSLEINNYPNYVFTNYHLQPNNFFYAVIFGSLVLLLNVMSTKEVQKYYLKLYHNFENNNNKKRFILNFGVIFILVLYFINNMTLAINDAISSNIYIFTHLNDSYADKMRVQWKSYSDFMLFVDNYTEGSSTIVVPPTERPWLTVGNSSLSRYFTYPKKVIEGSYSELPEEMFDYVTIAVGSWNVAEEERYNWPKVQVPAEKIWYIDLNTLSIEESFSDFDPADERNKGAWGLIKVDKSRLK